MIQAFPGYLVDPVTRYFAGLLIKHRERRASMSPAWRVLTDCAAVSGWLLLGIVAYAPQRSRQPT